MTANEPKTIDPMQAFLAGALLGCVDKNCRAFMKIVELLPNGAPTGFEVVFASGLRLAVKVELVERPHAEG